METRHQEIIEALERCAAACDHCAASCLEEDNVAMMARCISLDMDCAQICRFAAGALTRNSENAGAIARLCADICGACASECSKHDHDHCRKCAEACEHCAESCRTIAA